jgi:PAS domain S-box-containing protein
VAGPAEVKNIDKLLNEIVSGTASVIGEAFYRSLVQQLAKILDVRYAFVAVFVGGGRDRVRALSFWSPTGFLDGVEYDIVGTPCEQVLLGEMRLYSEGVAEIFPQDKALKNMQVVSYLAMPLFNSQQEVMGHLAVLDDKPLYTEQADMSVFQIFGSRVVAELERQKIERALRSSEARLSTILDSTRDAIIVIDHQRVIKLFNKAAEKNFRHSADQAIGDSVDKLLAKPFRKLLENYLEGQDGNEPDQISLWAKEGLTALRQDGTEFPVEMTVSPSEIEGERHYAFILRDINERQRAEEELSALRRHTDYLLEEIKGGQNFENIIGHSTNITKIFSNIDRVSNTDTTVLLMGETGVGKELFARALHERSLRKDKVLVKVNCAVLPAELIESELFGHQKGAFTGAIAQRVGRFELANGGTLFLDEVGELTPQAQVKLLRVLQEQEFERVGGTETIKVDVRLIAATNRDLGKMVEEGTFRADLFYRLNVFPLRIPPLRERTDDIPELTSHFLKMFSRKVGRNITDLSADSLDRLMHYHWPGNVRELQNIIERATILSDGPIVEVADALLVSHSAIQSQGSRKNLVDVEREHITKVLEETSWAIEGKAGAAAILGLAPSTLRSRMTKFGIARPES